MLLALALAGCVPAHWFSGVPESLGLLKGTPVNCLLIEKKYWTAPLVAEGHRLGLKLLASLDTPDAAIPADADAAYFEGDPPPNWEPKGKPVLILGSRERIRPSLGVAAIAQGVWPGIRVDDKVITTPTTAPWIDTNLGFLRYLRSQIPETVWMANRPPPEGKNVLVHPYQKAMIDAALAGARWVISPSPEFAAKLVAGDQTTRKEWDELMSLERFIESLPDVRALKTYSRLGVSVNHETGALVSGGVLDMIGAQHIPFQVAKEGKGLDQFFDFADNSIVKFPKTSLGLIAMRPGDADGLEALYRRVEVNVGRTNFGLRFFNGVGLLSAPYELPANTSVLVLIANYTDYPTEDMTIHVLGKWKKATMDAPGQPTVTLSMYPVGEATAIEIPKLERFGAVHVE